MIDEPEPTAASNTDLHAAPPETGLPPAEGWYEDPFGAHEARWFSAGEPTSLVRDAGAESEDVPPAAGPSPEELTPATTGPQPGEGADLRRADEAAATDQSFAPSDAFRAGLNSEGDLSTGTG